MAPRALLEDAPRPDAPWSTPSIDDPELTPHPPTSAQGGGDAAHAARAQRRQQLPRRRLGATGGAHRVEALHGAHDAGVVLFAARAALCNSDFTPEWPRIDPGSIMDRE